MPDRLRRPTRGAPSRAASAARRRAPLAALVALAACGPAPVDWNDLPDVRLDAPAATAAAAPDAAADSLVRAVVNSLHRRGWATTEGGDGVQAPGGRGSSLPVPWERPAPPPTLAQLPPDPAGARCPLSLQVAAVRAPARPAPPAGADPHAAHLAHAAAPAAPAAGAAGPAAAAVWWAQRPDRSAALYLSRTGDGGRTWSAPLAVDTLDRSEAGCERPAPSLAVDSTNGYLHVAYSMRAPEGPGVFYAHQMDPRGPFERPQVIVYGERPAATSVASAGDRVVVAYEDPNTGGRPFVSIALSHTAGHSWAERVPVSASNVAAERPVVALRGGRDVVLGWVERVAPRQLTTTDDPRAAVTALPSGVVVRVGRLRD